MRTADSRCVAKDTSRLDISGLDWLRRAYDDEMDNAGILELICRTCEERWMDEWPLWLDMLQPRSDPISDLDEYGDEFADVGDLW